MSNVDQGPSLPSLRHDKGCEHISLYLADTSELQEDSTHKSPLGETTTGAASVFATVVAILILVRAILRNSREQTKAEYHRPPVRGQRAVQPARQSRQSQGILED